MGAKLRVVRFLIADVTSFLELCTRCSDDSVSAPTKIMIPHFQRQAPPTVHAVKSAIQESIESSLPEPFVSHLKSDAQYGHHLGMGSPKLGMGSRNLAKLVTSLFGTTPPLLCTRVMQRLDRLSVVRSPGGSNFNRVASYWLSRWNWVQFPIFVTFAVSKELCNSSENLNSMLDKMESSEQLEQSNGGERSKKRRHRRHGVSLEGRRRRTSSPQGSPMSVQSRSMGTENSKTKRRANSNKKDTPKKAMKTTPMRTSASAPGIGGTASKHNGLLGFSPQSTIASNPFGALNQALSRSNASTAEKVASLRHNIMMQKHELNQLVVTRRKLQEQRQGRKGVVDHFRRTMTETENMLARIQGAMRGGGDASNPKHSPAPSFSSSSLSSSSSFSEDLDVRLRRSTRDLLLQQMLRGYLLQVRHVCGSFTGEDPVAENTAMSEISKLYEQIDTANRELQEIRSGNRKMEGQTIPAFAASLERFQRLKQATLTRLKQGTDVLARIELAEKAEQQRKSNIRDDVYSKASAKEKAASRKETTSSFMRALGLRDKKNIFKSGTRAMSYKNAGEKLHLIGVDEPLDILDRMQVQHSTWRELDTQVRSLFVFLKGGVGVRGGDTPPALPFLFCCIIHFNLPPYNVFLFLKPNRCAMGKKAR